MHAWLLTQLTLLRSETLATYREGRIVLSPLGQEVETSWRAIPGLVPGVAIDAFVIMPNHLHGIIIGSDDAATRVEDLRLPPSNRLEPLHGDRAGHWSIRINDQWRICFRFEDGDALDVEIVDYH